MKRRRADFDKKLRGARSAALERHELREASTPREAPASPISLPIKADDPETRRLIDEAMAKRASAKREGTER